ncbi:MAG: hypothetical protein Kow00107_11060 [Planctomycetota bacterium]
MVEFLKKIHYFSLHGKHRFDFLRDIVDLTLEHTKADALTFLVNDEGLSYICEASHYPEARHVVKSLHDEPASSGSRTDPLEHICILISEGAAKPSGIPITASGSFCAQGSSLVLISEATGKPKKLSFALPPNFRSYAFLPFSINQHPVVLVLKTIRPDGFAFDGLPRLEVIAHAIGLSASEHRAKSRLRERVKELGCLYGISRLAERADISADEFLREVTELLPPAWQFSTSSWARIVFDGVTYESGHVHSEGPSISEQLTIGGVVRGSVSVGYLPEISVHAEELFLLEERKLLETVSKEMSVVLERILTAAERAEMLSSLQHADRLLTIGHFAAGVAHQLNEPLGAILGYAQLAAKQEGLPEKAKQDIAKIVKASLSAREIVRKLLIFARQSPARKNRENINSLMLDALNLVEYRLQKRGLTVVTDFSPDLPEVFCDGAQIQQVAVNLLVNAEHASPPGSRITVSTRHDGKHVSFSVKDSGSGVDPKIAGKIFLPFFTTKEVGVGTGLGLSVAHGIVLMHGGRIGFENSESGAIFTVVLPVNPGEKVQ